MTLEQRVSLMEEVAGDIRDGLNRMDNRLDRMETRLDRFEDRFERLETKLDSHFKWAVGLTVTLWSTTMLGVIATLLTILIKQ